MTAPAIVVRVRWAGVVRWTAAAGAPGSAWSIDRAVIDVFDSAEVEALRALEAAGVSVPVIFHYGGRDYIGPARIDASGVHAVEVARGVDPVAAAGWSFASDGPAAVIP